MNNFVPLHMTMQYYFRCCSRLNIGYILQEFIIKQHMYGHTPSALTTLNSDCAVCVLLSSRIQKRIVLLPIGQEEALIPVLFQIIVASEVLKKEDGHTSWLHSW